MDANQGAIELYGESLGNGSLGKNKHKMSKKLSVSRYVCNVKFKKQGVGVCCHVNICVINNLMVEREI